MEGLEALHALYVGAVNKMSNNDLTERADEKAKHFEKWANVCFNSHTVLITCSNASAIFVPFGLAALLYIPEDSRQTLNIVLLVVSAIGLASQVVNQSLALKHRARRLRLASQKIDSGLRSFHAGEIDASELLLRYDEATLLHVEEEP